MNSMPVLKSGENSLAMSQTSHIDYSEVRKFQYASFAYSRCNNQIDVHHEIKIANKHRTNLQVEIRYAYIIVTSAFATVVESVFHMHARSRRSCPPIIVPG